MSIKEKYYIQEINYETAMNVVVKCHYAHRIAPCSRAFGLYSRDLNRLVGVVTYGSPVGRCLCENICGIENVHNVYELTRLYVDDGLEKNLESFLVANTLKLLDKEIIVSYADTAWNHVGIIYQATNFLYTGLSAKRNDPITEGGKHYRHNTATIKGGAESVARSQKHRYVYFNANKHRKKELLEKLNYPILPYPKQSCAVPITSTENIQDNKRKTLF